MSEASIVTDEHQEGEIKAKKTVSKERYSKVLQQEEARPRVHTAEQEQSKAALHTKCRTPRRNVESITWSTSKTFTTK